LRAVASWCATSAVELGVQFPVLGVQHQRAMPLHEALQGIQQALGHRGAALFTARRRQGKRNGHDDSRYGPEN
jgi:hypothetical protein